LVLPDPHLGSELLKLVVLADQRLELAQPGFNPVPNRPGLVDKGHRVELCSTSLTHAIEQTQPASAETRR
jgi:hypothetical protein